MKKLIFLLIILAALLPAKPAAAFTVYQNPHRIIIATPSDNATTTASHISLLGACDFTQPLLLNGKPLSYTKHGFFTAYASLNIGKNSFTLSQGDESRTVSITRTAATSQSSNRFSWDKLITAETPQWGTVRGENITRRSLPDSSAPLLNPLAQGTTCRIIGSWGDYYCLSDKSFVHQSSLRQISPPNDALLRTVCVTPHTEQNCTELTFDLPYIPLYSVQLTERAAVLTLRDTAAAPNITCTDNPLFSNLLIKSDGNDTTVILPLNQSVCGYYLEHRDTNKIVFGLKLPPKLRPHDMNNPNLSGATVLIDAGHGGEETGAVGAAAAFAPLEKDINLSIANQTAACLQKMGAKVITTRTQDFTLPLADRVAQIQTTKPDLSISIHANSLALTADYSQTHGIRTYYSCDTAASAADYINRRISGQGSNTHAIAANLALTRTEVCPAILIETAFMSNPNDYERLIDSDFQRQTAHAIAHAAALYLVETAN